jgi:Pyridoxamine 5'-phosphate oxidase
MLMRWEDIERQDHRLSRVMHERLIGPGVLLVATVRRDGTARLSPVEPLVLDGDLWLSMLWQSRKAYDLLRDDRLLLHSIITTRSGTEGEVKVRGRALPVDDPASRRRYRDAVAILGWQPEEPEFHLFRVEITDVTIIRYAPNGDQYTARWPSRIESVRRETSPTSLGAAEPIVDLFPP